MRTPNRPGDERLDLFASNLAFLVAFSEAAPALPARAAFQKPDTEPLTRQVSPGEPVVAAVNLREASTAAEATPGYELASMSAR